MEKASIAAIQEQKAAAIRCIQDYASKTAEWMRSVLVSFQFDVEKAKACSADVARLEQTKVQLGKLIEQAKVLVGVLESTEELKLVPLLLIIQLLERIQWWIELMMPTAATGVSFDPITREIQFAPNPFNWAKISSLVKLSVETLKKQAAQTQGQLTKPS